MTAEPGNVVRVPGQGATRIVIALDGSRAAEAALSFVAAHFAPAQTEVHLVSVVSAEEASRLRISADRSPIASFRRLYLRAAAQDLRGFAVRCIVGAHHSPGEALLIYARERGMQLVVVTNHGSGGEPDALGATVATLLFARSVPVLVVPAPQAIGMAAGVAR